MDLKTVARKFALKNAFDYGKAEAKSVVGKVIAEFPEAKKDMKSALAEIANAVEEANTLGKSELEKALSAFEFAEKKEEKEKKFSLPGAEEGKVVTRFLPEPNGPPHLGHAKAAFLSAEFARQYDGKCLLRWDDTNPEKEKQEFADQIRGGLNWLGLKFDSETYASDYMPKLYAFAEQLVSQGDAYACACTQEEMKKNRVESKECACRSKSVADSLSLWKKMLDRELKEGDATLRLKADLKSLNTTMRDPVLFRIMLTSHYRQGEKYCVWPVYDFEACIVDSLEGVTHAFRSKEYELRDELYYFILDKLGVRKPFVYDFSRLDIQGTVLSKRVLRPFIESGKVWGWDDPRLPTLMGLKRRGLLPQAIRSFVLSFGLSKVESSPSLEALLRENQKLLETQANHYFFVENPVKVLVKNAPSGGANPLKHQEFPERGKRFLDAKSDFYIAKRDFDALTANETFRLKELFNAQVVEKKKDLLIAKFAGKDLLKELKKIQWVPVEGAVACEVLQIGDLLRGEEFNPASLRTARGFCERSCKDLNDGDFVQFERVGFARLDDKTKMRFILIS